LAVKGVQILDALKCKFQYGCMHKFTRSITIFKWPLAFWSLTALMMQVTAALYFVALVWEGGAGQCSKSHECPSNWSPTCFAWPLHWRCRVLTILWSQVQVLVGPPTDNGTYWRHRLQFVPVTSL